MVVVPTKGAVDFQVKVVQSIAAFENYKATRPTPSYRNPSLWTSSTSRTFRVSRIRSPFIRERILWRSGTCVKALIRASIYVVLIERDDFLGGIPQQCIHNDFGLQLFNDDLKGPEYGKRFI